MNRDEPKPEKATHSVSWWSEAERMWQFAGEGSRAWAFERSAELTKSGHTTRVRSLSAKPTE